MSSYEVLHKPNQVPIYMFTKGVEVEDEVKQQLNNLSTLPFIHHHIAVMPDCHAGKGSTIGSVIPTTAAIIPAAVGVDLGCGMMATLTTIKAEQLPDNLAKIRSEIEAAVPHGRTDDGGPNDRGAWDTITDDIAIPWCGSFDKRWKAMVDKHPDLGKGHVNHINHLGTLGTGNHFIEVCLDEKDRVWVVLHSGSRGVGNRIGTYFISKAQEDMRRWFINLPDKDLAYIPEGAEYFDDYIQGVRWAQEFARTNRELMMDAVLGVLAQNVDTVWGEIDTVINCHHNYVEKEAHYGKNVWLTRKGAVRARKGDYGIIPGSMGVGSFIVKGKGNQESLNSCSHGAGRKMSRTKAKNTISIEDHIKATQGIECRKDPEVLDESPAAYKDLNAVMSAQEDLIEIVHKLRPLICVKG